MEIISVDDLLRWGAPLFITLAATVVLYWILSRFVVSQSGNRLYRQLAQVALMLIANIVLVLALPFDADTQAQLLSLFGLVLTAVIGLSSTTFVSNAMAGVMLKAMGSFKTGDFIRVADNFGRVSAKTLLHTAIQSEDRDTITLPNLFLITNPVQVVDQSGTLISATVSLGYDVHRHQVRESLLKAATRAQLAEPFMQIVALNDFSVSYKVTGFLADVTTLVSKRTELMGAVMDALHEHNIEVMTPSVMAQRPLPPDEVVTPDPSPTRGSSQVAAPEIGKAERMMFDKAEMAARIADFRHQSEQLAQEIAELEADKSQDNTREIAWRKNQLSALTNLLAGTGQTE